MNLLYDLILYLWLVAILGVDLTKTASVSVCSSKPADGSAQLGDACYLLFKNKVRWEAGKTECDKLRGNLVQTRSEEELAIVADLMNTRSVHDVWLGARQHIMGWKWLDNSELDTYAPWTSDETNNNGENCASLRPSHSFNWTKTLCASPRGFICEIGVDNVQCDNTRITRLGQRCFIARTAAYSWFQARRVCNTLGGDLAKVDSLALHMLLHNSLEGQTSATYWIGLRNSKWIWETGEEAVTTFWEPSQPTGSGRCVLLRRFSQLKYMWDTYDCTRKMSYICRLGPTPSGKTTIPVESAGLVMDTTPVPQITDENAGPGASLTGPLTVIVILLIVVLGIILTLFLCYWRRGRVLRERARQESQIITERGKGFVNVYPNLAFHSGEDNDQTERETNPYSNFVVSGVTYHKYETVDDTSARSLYYEEIGQPHNEQAPPNPPADDHSGHSTNSSGSRVEQCQTKTYATNGTMTDCAKDNYNMEAQIVTPSTDYPAVKQGSSQKPVECYSIPDRKKSVASVSSRVDDKDSDNEIVRNREHSLTEEIQDQPQYLTVLNNSQLMSNGKLTTETSLVLESFDGGDSKLECNNGATNSNNLEEIGAATNGNDTISSYTEPVCCNSADQIKLSASASPYHVVNDTSPYHVVNDTSPYHVVNDSQRVPKRRRLSPVEPHSSEIGNQSNSFHISGEIDFPDQSQRVNVRRISSPLEHVVSNGQDKPKERRISPVIHDYNHIQHDRNVQRISPVEQIIENESQRHDSPLDQTYTLVTRDTNLENDASIEHDDQEPRRSSPENQELGFDNLPQNSDNTTFELPPTEERTQINKSKPKARSRKEGAKENKTRNEEPKLRPTQNAKQMEGFSQSQNCTRNPGIAWTIENDDPKCCDIFKPEHGRIANNSAVADEFSTQPRVDKKLEKHHRNKKETQDMRLNKNSNETTKGTEMAIDVANQSDAESQDAEWETEQHPNINCNEASTTDAARDLIKQYIQQAKDERRKRRPDRPTRSRSSQRDKRHSATNSRKSTATKKAHRSSKHKKTNPHQTSVSGRQSPEATPTSMYGEESTESDESMNTDREVGIYYEKLIESPSTVSSNSISDIDMTPEGRGSNEQHQPKRDRKQNSNRDHGSGKARKSRSRQSHRDRPSYAKENVGSNSRGISLSTAEPERSNKSHDADNNEVTGSYTDFPSHFTINELELEDDIEV